MLITIVDKEEKIDGLLPILDKMISNGLVTISKVEVIKYTHGQSDTEDLSLSPESKS